MIGNAEFLAQFRATLSEVRASQVFLPQGIGLAPTDDAFPVIKKKGCHFEQLANYKDDDSKLYIDQEIYDHLMNVDRAAFLVHEATSKIARVNQGDTSTVRSRKLTSQVLATYADQGVIDSLMAAMVRKPEPVVVNRLRDGVYGTSAKYCGLRIFVQGDRLTTVGVPNPLSSVGCNDAGSAQEYNWASARKRNGQTVWGFRHDCSHDLGHWCGLIEVINDHTFVQYGKSEVLFELQ